MPAGRAASVNRWTPLVAGMYLELCGGSVYITSLYLATVKELWFASRADATLLMQQLVYASNLGCFLPLAGIFYDSRHASPLYLPCISPVSPMYLPCMSHVSPPYLPIISPISPL